MRNIILSLVFVSTLFSDVILVGNYGCKINTISNIELKNLYLGLNKMSKEEKINIFDREEKRIYEEFVTHKLKKSIVLLETYWVRMLFSGKAKPPKKISALTLKELNSLDECAIVYIEEKELTKMLKRIDIVE